MPGPSGGGDGSGGPGSDGREAFNNLVDAPPTLPIAGGPPAPTPRGSVAQVAGPPLVRAAHSYQPHHSRGRHHHHRQRDYFGYRAHSRGHGGGGGRRGHSHHNHQRDHQRLRENVHGIRYPEVQPVSSRDLQHLGGRVGAAEAPGTLVKRYDFAG